MTGSLRWRIAALIGAAIAISYFDRQTLPVAITAIQREIPITNTQFSQLQAAFLTAYALMYAGGGKLVDTLGTRRGFLAIMIWWSLACASHGLATGFGLLAVSRFLLGMGEGGGFPAATKAVAEWFSARERATAMGIINAGTAAGAVCAPPLIATVLAYLNWRWIFFLSGALGLVWAVWWMRDYFPPAIHPKLTAGERGVLAEVFKPDAPSSGNVAWLRLLGFAPVWGLVFAKFLSDAGWYFYLFWLPKYLYDARGFDTKQVGVYAWIPYAASGVGCLFGGWYSSRLIRGGHSVDFSRKMALGLSAAVMPSAYFITKAPVELAIVLFSIAFFGQQSWSTLVMVLPADLFPRGAVGSVAGMVGFGGAMGGVVFGLVVGYLLDHHYGYGVVFAIVSTLHVAAFGVIMTLVRKLQPLISGD